MKKTLKPHADAEKPSSNGYWSKVGSVLDQAMQIGHSSSGLGPFVIALCIPAIIFATMMARSDTQSIVVGLITIVGLSVGLIAWVQSDRGKKRH